jgi:hypothetical protein
LEINKIITEDVEIFEGDRQFPILKVLNFFSSRLSFFIIPVGKEGFINLFLGLLDFPGKNVKIF